MPLVMRPCTFVLASVLALGVGLSGCTSDEDTVVGEGDGYGAPSSAPQLPEVEVPLGQFVRVGVLVTVPTLAICLVVLYLLAAHAPA